MGKREGDLVAEFVIWIEEKEGSIKFPASKRRNVRERFTTRIYPMRWHKNGIDGANAYLGRYGRGIGIEKLIHLAMYADGEGHHVFAMGFWAKAYQVETKCYPSGNAMRAGLPASEFSVALNSIPAQIPSTAKSEVRHYDGFNRSNQPGEVVPIQPVDAQYPKKHYVTLVTYWGQPKRDGHKLIVFATEGSVWYQSRSKKLLETPPDPDMHSHFMAVAKDKGTFILEGELYHLDAEGREHQTAATAVASNKKAGISESIQIVFSAFGCLYWDNQHLTLLLKRNQVETGEKLMLDLAALDPNIFHVMKTARTNAEKSALVEDQKDREGEIWFRYDLKVQPGKLETIPDLFFDGYVRTKNRLEAMRLRITKVAPGKADGHAIAGFDVEDENGRHCGRVGTGYSREQQREILSAFESEPENTYALVSAQRWSVGDILIHSVFEGLVE